MTSHSSVLAWRIPGTGEPDGLPSYGVAQSRGTLGVPLEGTRRVGGLLAKASILQHLAFFMVQLTHP